MNAPRDGFLVVCDDVDCDTCFLRFGRENADIQRPALDLAAKIIDAWYFIEDHEGWQEIFPSQRCRINFCRYPKGIWKTTTSPT